MPVSIAEYLGQRTDIHSPTITPGTRGDQCPFMNAPCAKLAKGGQPFCSVRKTDGTLWIACEHRLCATRKNTTLSTYQTETLHGIAQVLFHPSVSMDEICVKREECLLVDQCDTKYKADYIMTFDSGKSRYAGPDRLVLEMQGGGETSQTKKLTDHVARWARNPARLNSQLRTPIQGVGTIETNAWRRQQEQFIVKGNIAMKTWKGYGIAFCVGEPLYDYLYRKVVNANVPDLRRYNWTLALVGISEDRTASVTAGPVPLVVDANRLLFTNYQTFVQALINQGEPSSSAFGGSFTTLSGRSVVVPTDG